MNGGPVNLASARPRRIVALRNAFRREPRRRRPVRRRFDRCPARRRQSHQRRFEPHVAQPHGFRRRIAGARLRAPTSLSLATSLRIRSSKAWATPSPCFPTISNLRCLGRRQATPNSNWTMAVRHLCRPSRLAAGVARCLGWSEAGPSRRQCRKSNRNGGALQDVARLAHDLLLDLLLRQPRGGAKREDGDRQYLASVIVLVSELDIVPGQIWRG